MPHVISSRTLLFYHYARWGLSRTVMKCLFSHFPSLSQLPPYSLPVSTSPLHHYPLPVAHAFPLLSGLWYKRNPTIPLPTDWPVQWPSNIPISILLVNPPTHMQHLLSCFYYPNATNSQTGKAGLLHEAFPSSHPSSLWSPPSLLPMAFTALADHLALLVYYLELLFNLSCIWVLRTA